MFCAILPSSLHALVFGGGRVSLPDLRHLTALTELRLDLAFLTPTGASCHTYLLCKCFHLFAPVSSRARRIGANLLCRESIQVQKILASRMRRHSLLKSAVLWAMQCMPRMISLPPWLLWSISRPLRWTLLMTPGAVQRICCAPMPCSHCHLASLSLYYVGSRNVCLLLHYLRTLLLCCVCMSMKSRCLASGLIQ